ncbi:MAG: twin transmembrane helix small protein [Gammaproteobacteria bacterium]
MKFIVILLLLGIVASLGSGLFFLVKDDGDNKRMVKALTVRIILSVALFVFLIFAWATGLIQPRGSIG